MKILLTIPPDHCIHEVRHFIKFVKHQIRAADQVLLVELQQWLIGDRSCFAARPGYFNSGRGNLWKYHQM